MNLGEAVLDCYGCRIPQIPCDGEMYSFPIDQFRIGYAINFGEVYIFGCRADGDNYYFDGVEWNGFRSEPKRPPKQEFNRMIIACARGLIERGEVLNSSDAARLSFAVQQVEANS